MLLKISLILFGFYFTDIDGLVNNALDYKNYPELHGLHILHDEPADWNTARANCQKEGALLASLWMDQVSSALPRILNSNAGNSSISVLYSGAQVIFPEGTQNISSDNNTYCMVFFVNNGTMGRDDCKQRHPYVCFTPTKDDDTSEVEWSDYKYYPKLRGWLRLHKSADWNTARATCKTEGASLASLWTDEFESALFGIMMVSDEDSSVEELTVPALYTGALVMYPDGVYSGVEGALTFSDDYHNNTQCMVIFANSTMVKVDCGIRYPYVCYAPATDLDCGNKDDGYKIDNRTGHCYRFRDVGHGWNETRNICHETGADLAIINSDEESKFLKELFSNYNSLYYTYHGSHAFVGIEETSVGIWKTIDGDTLEAAGFARWAVGEPDNKQSSWPDYVKDVRQSCGAMDRDGFYSDCWCEMQHAYICEKQAVKRQL